MDEHLKMDIFFKEMFREFFFWSGSSVEFTELWSSKEKSTYSSGFYRLSYACPFQLDTV